MRPRIIKGTVVGSSRALMSAAIRRFNVEVLYKQTVPCYNTVSPRTFKDK